MNLTGFSAFRRSRRVLACPTNNPLSPDELAVQLFRGKGIATPAIWTAGPLRTPATAQPTGEDTGAAADTNRCYLLRSATRTAAEPRDAIYYQNRISSAHRKSFGSAFEIWDRNFPTDGPALGQAE